MENKEQKSNIDQPVVSGSFSWNNNDFPYPQSINDECNDYYLVKVKGYSHPTMAMYLEDEDGNAGWYVNYFAKIVKEVIGWKDVS